MSAVTRLVLPLPPSANTYWVPARGRGLVPSKTALAYKRQIATICANVRPLIGNVTLSGIVFRGRAVGDLGNFLKVLEDALNGYAWLDDRQVVAYQRFELSPFTDPSRPRVELELTGERFATLDEAARHRAAKAETARKARATRNANRRTKALKPAVYR